MSKSPKKDISKSLKGHSVDDLWWKVDYFKTIVYEKTSNKSTIRSFLNQLRFALATTSGILWYVYFVLLLFDSSSRK